MNRSIILFIVGWVMRFEGLFLLLPFVVSLICRESRPWAYLLVAALCFGGGFLMSRKKPQGRLFPREGYVSVGLSWIVISLLGALPFVITGDIPSYMDAAFETISGFTTTGASILNDVEALSASGLFWRSFTHWIGGMGVFVFMMALLPLIGGSDMNLMKAESPGPSVERLVPHVKDTAKILYMIYTGITVAEILILLATGMEVLDAFCISFGSVGTGGFGVRNDSCGGYTVLQQNIVAMFMIICGVNFTAYFYLRSRRFRDAFRMEEVRWFLISLLGAVALVAVSIAERAGSAAEAAQQALFQVASVMTTTGFATADYDLWPVPARMILVVLMFTGACAGSTAGGIKMSRIVILVKSLWNETKMVIHPRAVRKVRLDGRPLKPEVLRATNGFIAAYFAVFMVSAIAISIDCSDITTDLTAVAATLSNVGPGLSQVGPACNFSFFSPFSKIVLMIDMLAGRLEIFPILVLLSPACWRNR